MNKKTSKSGIVTAIVIAIVFLVLLNICTFAIPFNKVNESVHFIAYGCCEFVIIAEMVLIISQLFVESNRNQKILGLPIIYAGYIITFIQIIVTIIFYIVNSYIALPIWLVVLIEVFIIGFGAIQVSKGFFFKLRNEQYHQEIASTKFMDEFRAKLKIIYNINKNENLEKDLRDLLDIALGSDPVSNDKTVEFENKLIVLLQELEEVIKSGSETSSHDAIINIKNTLLERNVLCKAGK